jgi:tetratricopeptide (TPR) repeat protein
LGAAFRQREVDQIMIEIFDRNDIRVLANECRQAAGITLSSPAASYKIAKTLMATKRYRDASDAFQRVLDIDPNYQLAWNGLFRCCEITGC